MKTQTLFLALPFVLLLRLPAGAATVEASWDRVTHDVDDGSETISHYILYYGETSRPGGVVHPSDGAFSYDTSVNVGNLTIVQRSDLVGGRRYFFSVAAVDIGGNISDYSAEVNLDVPEEPDGGSQDAGGGDGGQPADAGVSDDGGGGDTSGKVEGGCGCGANGSVGWGWLLVPAAWWIVRRRPEQA